MRFGVLGPLTVWTSRGRPVVVPERKVRAVLAVLLVHRGRAVSVDRLVEDVWGDEPPGNPANTVQTKVSQLRGVLERAEPGGRALVERRPPGYLLSAGDDDVDAGRFAALAARSRAAADPAARAAAAAEALALWRGPAFADFADAAFARTEIARLEEQRLTLLEEHAEARLALGEHGPLADELGEAVAAHPLRERLRRAHLRALYRSGRQAEALDAFEDLRRRLAEELGASPAPGTAALHQEILRQSPALERPLAPARARTNLPLAPAPLVGRAAAVADVGALLTEHRLVTLTGPGGVGKTRLALAAAEQATGTFPDGVWLVELADEPGPPGGAGAPEAVAEAVAAAAGVRDDGRGGDAVRALTEALRARRTLLVLDNCEHLARPVAELTRRLLAAAPGLRVLATSREPLAIAGEVLHEVPPLPEEEAVRLFASLAAASAPGFRLDEATAATVASVCRRLDGLPLALELAAGRVRALGVHGLAERLDDRFRLLTSARRDAPARQRTLRAVIDWSWEPLDAPERAVLRRLSVFRGGCSLVAAEAVCSGPDLPPGDVLDVLTRLVDRSLVVAAPGGTGPRYRLLESVAAYGQERLREAGEAAGTGRRHAAHVTELAERAAPRLHGADQRHWLAVLDTETANLRAALRDCAGRGDAPGALRLAGALAWYWFLRGRLGEARRALDTALDTVPREVPPDAAGRAAADAEVWRAAFASLAGEPVPVADDALRRAGPRARWFLAFARSGFGDQDDGLLDRVVADATAAGDRWTVAAALSARAGQAIYRGDLAVLRRDATRSAELFADLGDRWGRLQATEQLGVLAEIAGDYGEAARLHQEGVRVAEELALWPSLSFRLSRLGRIALLTGDVAGAADYHERARRLAVDQSHKPAEQFAETGLALTARRRGDLDAAEAHLRPWLDWNRRLGVHAGAALVLALLGFVAEDRGDAAGAAALHREGLATARKTGDPRAVALALEGLAGARALAGASVAAARLLGTAARLRAEAHAPLPAAERADVDRATARARAALGDPGFDAEFRRGRAMRPEDHDADG